MALEYHENQFSKYISFAIGSSSFRDIAINGMIALNIYNRNKDDRFHLQSQVMQVYWDLLAEEIEFRYQELYTNGCALLRQYISTPHAERERRSLEITPREQYIWHSQYGLETYLKSATLQCTYDYQRKSSNL